MKSQLPTVAIIGQANVGKSSLFNRLVQSKQAIVAREAGTTRDNVIGKVSIVSPGGVSTSEFWLVDTAGLKDPADEFEASIQEQIGEATEVADVILVVVDGSKYVNDQDRLAAKKALKSKKPVLLAINKSDLKDSLPDSEFRKLGIKDVIRTSAEHNVKIGEVIERIATLIPAKHETTTDNVLRIALIGRPNAGKSRLFNTMAGKQQAIVATMAGTTRDINRISVRFKSRDIELLDTAGVRKPGKQEVGIEKFSVLRTLQAIEQADICLLLMDVNEVNAQLDQRLAGIISDAGKGLIIVISKWDAVEDKDPKTRDQIAKSVAQNFKFTPWAPLVFTSSITGQNVAKIFDLALDIDDRRQQPTKTSVLNGVLQKSIRRHPPAGLKNTYPKLKYIVQTDTSPPWFVVYGSSLKLLHWSYKRYLDRQLRETYDYTGTPIKFSFRDSKDAPKNKER